MANKTKTLRQVVLWAMGEHQLLDKKFRKLKKYTWHQEDWAVKQRNGVCQTAYCIAGATVAMTGYKLPWSEKVWNNGYSILDYDKQVETKTLAICYGKNGETFEIEDAAKHELGLDFVEVEELFDGDNSIERVIEVATEIAYRRGKHLFRPQDLTKMDPKFRKVYLDTMDDVASRMP